MVAYPDRDAGNDPELFFFFFFFFRGVGSLSQPRLNIFTVDIMRVMICLGQGGLRSLSASSLYFVALPACSWPELSKCSPRSQPNTRSFTIPLRLSVLRAGRDVKNVRRNEISLPRFRNTEMIKKYISYTFS